MRDRADELQYPDPLVFCDGALYVSCVMTTLFGSSRERKEDVSLTQTMKMTRSPEKCTGHNVGWVAKLIEEVSKNKCGTPS